jgi:hypothetical protein
MAPTPSLQEANLFNFNTLRDGDKGPGSALLSSNETLEEWGPFDRNHPFASLWQSF